MCKPMGNSTENLDLGILLLPPPPNIQKRDKTHPLLTVTGKKCPLLSIICYFNFGNFFAFFVTF